MFLTRVVYVLGKKEDLGGFISRKNGLERRKYPKKRARLMGEGFNAVLVQQFVRVVVNSICIYF